MEQIHDAKPQGRLVAKVGNVLRKQARYESMADFADALRFELARLKIRYTPAELSEALARLVQESPIVLISRLPQTPALAPMITREIQPGEAKRIQHELLSRYCAEQPAAISPERVGPEDFPNLVLVKPWK